MSQKPFTLTRASFTRTIPNGTKIPYMSYTVSGCADVLEYLSLPCRAKLHHALTGLFYGWDWNDEEPKEITEEEAYMLKHIFSTQTEYKLWKKALQKIKELGVDEAKQWLMGQVKILTLRNMLRNG